MIIVRESFIAKPGMASKLAKLMKEVAEMPGGKAHVMTDMTGRFNKVVIETEFENMAEFEKRMTQYRENKDMGDKMKGYTDMYQTGKREIYMVW